MSISGVNNIIKSPWVRKTSYADCAVASLAVDRMSRAFRYNVRVYSSESAIFISH